MKYIGTVVLLFLLSVPILLTGCTNTGSGGVSTSGGGSPSSSGGNRLTESKAQKAVQAWVAAKNGGSVAVIGLQELTQQNSARADLQFTNLQYTDSYSGPQNFSGKGVAMFTHYTDGRWVLTQVATDNGLDSLIQTTNIEAK